MLLLFVLYGNFLADLRKLWSPISLYILLILKDLTRISRFWPDFKLPTRKGQESLASHIYIELLCKKELDSHSVKWILNRGLPPFGNQQEKSTQQIGLTLSFLNFNNSIQCNYGNSKIIKVKNTFVFGNFKMSLQIFFHFTNFICVFGRIGL